MFYFVRISVRCVCIKNIYFALSPIVQVIFKIVFMCYLFRLRKTKSTARCNRCRCVYKPKHELLCHVCGIPFNRVGTFHKHVGNRHPDEPKPAYKPLCSFCHELLQDLEDIEFHKKRRCNKRPPRYHCSQCFKRFEQEYLKNLHELTHEPGWAVSPILCPECGQVCKNYRFFETHSRNEHDISIVTCPICGFWTKDVLDIKSHLDEHMGVVSYLCDVCYTYFLNKGLFYLHMADHEKKMCPTCVRVEREMLNKIPN